MNNAKHWAVGLVAVALGAGCTGRHEAEDEAKKPVEVKFVQPKKGALERLCVQPGSVHSFESIQLFAQVAGYLKVQTVDIGYHVKKGALLAQVDVPDIEAQVRRNKALVEKADAQLLQMQSHVEVANANLEAAHAAVTQAKAAKKAAEAWVNYRGSVKDRIAKLVKDNSLQEAVLDEAKEKYTASEESLNAAIAAIVTTEANVKASKSKIDQAKADVVAARAEIDVANAELEKSQVSLAFATINSPFDGVITERSFNPKDFVRAADSGANIKPLLTIDRTDLFRVVVLVPDRDVEFIKEGKPATLEIDSLPGREFEAKVSRIANSLDPQTRLMRVELDLKNNDKNEIYNGMYGQVTIVLDKGTNKLSIPTSCVADKADKYGNAAVYVVRSGRAKKAKVILGFDTGLRVIVKEGLTMADQVILNPSSELSRRPEVKATRSDE